MNHARYGSWGDDMLAAGQAKLAHEADPQRRKVEILGEDGKRRWAPAWEGLDYIARPGEADPRGFRHITNGPRCRPYCVEPLTFDKGYQWTGWRARDNWPQFALTDAERRMGEAWCDRLGAFVLIEPHNNPRQMPNRHWGAARYQALAQLLNPQIPVLQMGLDPRLALEGVNFAHTASFREAMGVLSGAAAYIGNQGGLHHGAAALHVPAVILFGGTEPPELMGYPQNVNLVSRLPGSPCGRIARCEHCARAMAEITPDMVATALTVLLHKRSGAGQQGAA